jgi:hypothetical protein
MQQRQDIRAADSAHLSLTEQRPVVRGAGRRYTLAREDQLAFAAEVARFGFAPDEFAVDVERIRSHRLTSSPAPAFTVTITQSSSGRTATYVGGPGRSWVAEFLMALIAGEFGRAGKTRGSPHQ